MTRSFDICIVGAGIVGLTLANALAKLTDLSVAIIDTKSPVLTWDEKIYGTRVSAITLSSQKFLQKLNLWDELLKYRVSPFSEIIIWDSNDAELTFKDQSRRPQLGWIIENDLILDRQIENSKQLPITWLAPVDLHDLQSNPDEIILSSSTGEVIKTQLVVGADGANSWIRKAAAIDIESYEYGQHAIIANVQTELSHQQIARQLFLSTGPLAFLPLAQPNLSSIVWTLPQAQAEEMMQLDTATFLNHLNLAANKKLIQVLDVEKRMSFPLKFLKAKHYVKNRLVLIGDAAHVIHPLAGQGVNMGIADAEFLLTIIAQARRDKRDYWTLPTLRKYERERKSSNTVMIKAIHQLEKIFITRHRPLQRIRSIGLETIENLPWIKNFFIDFVG